MVSVCCNDGLNCIENYFCFPQYSNVIIYGGSGTGKSSLVRRLLLQSNDLFEIPPTRIHYIYSYIDDNLNLLRKSLSNFSMCNRPPTEEELNRLTANQLHTILIFDDCDINKNYFFQKLFSCIGHHFRCTIILCTQTMGGTKTWSNLHKSAHSYIIMSSPKSGNAVLSLGRQLGKYQFLKSVFEDVSRLPFNYLMVQLHPQSNRDLSFMSSILKDDYNEVPIVYMSRDT